MRKSMVLALVIVIGLCLTGYSFADDKEVCISLCEAAAKMMKEDFRGALCEINKKDGKFGKGNIFVFAARGGVLIAHPFQGGIGMDLSNFKTNKGKKPFKEFVRIVKEEGSGWVDYWVSKDSLKTTYVLKVDENFYVCAGYLK